MEKHFYLLIILTVLMLGLTGCSKKDKTLTYKAAQNAKQVVVYKNNFETLADIQNNLDKLKDITSSDFYSKNSDIEEYRKFEGFTQKVDVKYSVAEETSEGTRGVVVAKFITHNVLLDEIDVTIKSFYFETDSKGIVTLLSEIID